MAYWKQIIGFPNYTITSDGVVWSNNCDKIRKPYISNSGYKTIILCKKGKTYSKLIHRLVLEAFLGKCPDGMEACHNNGDCQDNRLENLRWDTRKNNIKDSIRHGTAICIKCGEISSNHKLMEKDVRMIIYMYRTGEFTQQEIADAYGICRGNIYHIVNRKTWKHIWRKE